VVSSPNILEGTVVESSGIRIGLFGLTIPTDGVEYVQSFAGRLKTARAMTARLRAQGAEVVVALTHLNARDDRRLLADLEDQGPDLIIGGHDHQRLLCRACKRWVIKADADARTASVVWLTLPAQGPLQVDHCFRALEGPDLPPDPDVDARVQDWLARHEEAFCRSKKEPAGCLTKKLGATRTLLDAEEYKIRGEESSLGNWVADQMVAAFSGCGAQAAFINSGGLRLNQDIPPGTAILRSHLEELFQYPTNLYLLSLKGKTLQEVVNHALVGWPGAGNWLQVSGFSFTHDVTAQSAKDLRLGPPNGGRAVQPDEDILVVVNDFLINPKLGQDGYTMLSQGQVVQGCSANGIDLKAKVVDALAKAAPKGIAPVVEGRIRQDRAAAVDICLPEDD
jgi:2',3'-cyclic-nucleotide 2'-phosphodiesterase (5'-nucleotidase family)